MDIGRTEGVSGAGRIEGPRIERATPPASAPVPGPVDKVEISQAGQMVSEALALPATRMDRVAELKKLVEAGTYQTDERLVGAMINFLRENRDLV